jgi:two-component system phosphate regulon response regulator PhoB
MKVLVVDDEQPIVDAVSYNLRKEGYDTVSANNAEQCMEIARREKPDLIVLDVMLPSASGFDVCRMLRRQSDVPIIMLTAKAEETDKVVGLELGADDYVTKPFSMRELVLRVRAILRRNDGEPAPVSNVEFGCLRIDREAHRVWVRTDEVELTALEFKLLVTLYDRRNRVQPRGALLDKVWGIDAKISTRTVDAHVKRLREKLGHARDYIETVRGVGYRFAENSQPQPS